MTSPDIIAWLLSHLGGNVPIAGSFWDFITGSGRDTINDTLEIVLKRPSPSFSSKEFLGMYDYTFYIGLTIGACVQAAAVTRAALYEGPLGVIKAGVVDFFLLIVVAFSLPAIATLGVTFTNQATAGIVGIFGGKPEVSWFESLLGVTQMSGWQSVLYGLIGIALLVEITAISLLPYVLVIAGPVMFAMRNLGNTGRRINLALWTNLAWSIATFFPFVLVLVLGNWLMTKLPTGAFISPGTDVGHVVTIIFLALTGYVPFWLHSKTKNLSVKVENELRGQVSGSGSGSGFGPVQSGTSPIHRFNSAVTTVSETDSKTTAQVVSQIGTQVGLAAARSHPATSAAATVIGAAASHIDKRQTQQAPAAQDHPVITGTVQSSTPAKPVTPPPHRPKE